MLEEPDDLCDKNLWVLDRPIVIPRADGGNEQTVAFFNDTDALSAFYDQFKESEAEKLVAWSQLGKLTSASVRNKMTHFVLNYGSKHERSGLLIDFLHVFTTGKDAPPRPPYGSEDET